MDSNMSHKSLFGSDSHFSNTSSWKAGSPISNPLLLKAQSRQVFMGLQQSHSTAESTITASWRPQPRDQFLCFPACNKSFSSAATKAWAFFSAEHEALHSGVSSNVEIEKPRDGWQSGNTPKASSKFLTKNPHPMLILPRALPREADGLWESNSRLLHDAAKMQGWNFRSQERQASGRDCMLQTAKRNNGNGFLKQTCRTSLLSAVRHILLASAAERLAATLPTHCC